MRDFSTRLNGPATTFDPQNASPHMLGSATSSTRPGYTAFFVTYKVEPRIFSHSETISHFHGKRKNTRMRTTLPAQATSRLARLSLPEIAGRLETATCNLPAPASCQDW